MGKLMLNQLASNFARIEAPVILPLNMQHSISFGWRLQNILNFLLHKRTGQQGWKSVHFKEESSDSVLESPHPLTTTMTNATRVVSGTSPKHDVLTFDEDDSMTKKRRKTKYCCVEGWPSNM